MSSKRYFVYIVTNQNCRVLYTGVTNDLERRISEHKSGEFPGLTRTYNAHLLVYYQEFVRIEDAIEREKRIKGGSRNGKIKLIEQMNPEWRDLSEAW